jgi:hypothetical protein
MAGLRGYNTYAPALKRTQFEGKTKKNQRIQAYKTALMEHGLSMLKQSQMDSIKRTAQSLQKLISGES